METTVIHQKQNETSSNKHRRPLGIVPIIAVTAALWGFGAYAAPTTSRQEGKEPAIGAQQSPIEMGQSKKM